MKKNETNNVPCTRCGRSDLPLHTNYQCAECGPEAEHTPTPWHRNVSPAYKYPIYADKNGDPNGKDWIHIAAVLSGNPNQEADLDLIVRAVNSHESLLDAAKDALNALENEGYGGTDTAEAVRKAIAKAEQRLKGK